LLKETTGAYIIIRVLHFCLYCINRVTFIYPSDSLRTANLTIYSVCRVDLTVTWTNHYLFWTCI